MSRLRQILGGRISSEAFDIRFAQLTCFAMAPALLFLATIALRKHASTPGELVIGLLSAASACFLCVVIGLLLPMTRHDPKN